MTRDANLYHLFEKDWQPLADILDSHQDYTLKDHVIIFKINEAKSVNHRYAILSLSDKADKVVEEYGAKLAPDNDLLRFSLHEYSGDTLYGDKSNVVFLNKPKHL